MAPIRNEYEARPRLLILVVAYNAENTISTVLTRIPHQLADQCAVEVLVLDDSSADRTFDAARTVQNEASLPFPLHVLMNPQNLGYGGNQKLGYQFAIEHDFDFVALLHGDGQYAPECLPLMVAPLCSGQADAVFGSRMLRGGAALKGGMPRYKYYGNRVLSWFQNRMLGTSLSEFHSGYRIYAVPTLKRIPFALNTNDFHFDTEIIIQLVLLGARICELPIPTYYGDEICHVNGLKYAADVARAVCAARTQHLGLFYDRRYDLALDAQSNSQYEPKLQFDSPQLRAFQAIPEGSRVLDLGCAGGHLGAMLRRERRCFVTGVDRHPLSQDVELDEFIRHDLNCGLPPVAIDKYDYVLLLDVIEHLTSPESLLEQLRIALVASPGPTLLVSTANVGFFVTRGMLLCGQFNYGKRGILDQTHTRLFTFGSFRRLFEQGGYRVLTYSGVPAPWPMVLGPGMPGRSAMTLHRWMIRFASGLFAYQIYMTVKPVPSLSYLLRLTREHSVVRTGSAI